MFCVRCLVVPCSVAAVLATRDVRAVKDTMVCVESSKFDGEECTVIGNRGGGTDVDNVPATVVGPSPGKTTGGGGSSASTTGYGYTTEPDSRVNPCEACTRNRRRALQISQAATDLCLEAARDEAIRICTESSVGAVDGRGRTVQPIHDGKLCCEKSNEAEIARQHAAQINPTVRGCGLVPVGYTGRVCLVGRAEKWWADRTGHNACPYPVILDCEPGYLIDPDNCFQSHTAGSPGTTNTTGSAAGVELDGGPAKFTGGGTQSSSTTWGQTGGSFAGCSNRAMKRDGATDEAYFQCLRTHNCGPGGNNPDHPSM